MSKIVRKCVALSLIYITYSNYRNRLIRIVSGNNRVHLRQDGLNNEVRQQIRESNVKAYLENNQKEEVPENIGRLE